MKYGAADFTQTRRLKGLKTPLVSRGKATLAANEVRWHVTSPSNVLTTITPAGLTQSVDGGAAQRVGPAGSDGFLGSAGLFDLLVGKFDTLGAHYTVSRSPGANGGWRMRLTPKSADMTRFIAQIDVVGCTRVEGVEVRQANGDAMEIALGPVAG